MKILCAYHGAPKNPGGILQHQETLGLALQELGHTVDMRTLLWRAPGGAVAAEPRRTLKQEVGPSSGLLLDQELGWFWPATHRIAYKGDAAMQRWKDIASSYDVIIWQTPVPTKKNDTRGNTDWVELYNLPPSVKQIGVVHDGNLADSYPWVYEVAEYLTGLVGVHPCGAAGAAQVPVRSTLIPNPHYRPLERARAAPDGRGRSGFAAIQTFKGWKHVPDVVRAIPYMQDYPKIIAGGGIDYYYLTSKDKMKSAYLANKGADPDLPDAYAGRRIWDVALEHGMDYRGYIDTETRERVMKQCRFFIDPSWSKKYAAAGDHFNRTPIEAIIAGCVPIARNLGVAGNAEGEGLLFKPGVNYCMIPYDATPKQFAQMTDEFMNMSDKRRKAMLEQGHEMLKHFDALQVAQSYIDFARGKPAGLKYCPKGADRLDLREAANAAMNEHFGAEE